MKNKILIAFSLLIILVLSYFVFSKKQKTYSHVITVTDIQKIGKIFIAQTYLTSIVKAKLDGVESIYVVKGKAKYYINIDEINIKYLNKEKNLINVIIDKPENEYKLIQKDSKRFSIDSENKPQSEIIDKEFRSEAEKVIKELANKENYVKIAREFGEKFIKNYFDNFGIKINRIYWRDLTPETLDEENIKNAGIRILSGITRCNKSRKANKVKLKYNIKPNGKIDNLIIENKNNKENSEIKTCIENFMYNFKYNEFYGEPIKIEDTFNIDKDKICENQTQKILKLGKGKITREKIKELAGKKAKNDKLASLAWSYNHLKCNKLYLLKEKKISYKSYLKENHIQTIKAENNCSIDKINIICLKKTGKSSCELTPRTTNKNSFTFGGISNGSGITGGKLEMKAQWRETCIYE